MLKKNVLRLLAMLLLTVMLFVTVACNTVYDIRTDEMDKPWEDGEPDEDGTDKNNGNNNNNNNNNNADNNDGENNTDELPESVGTNPFAGKTFIIRGSEYRFTENKVTVVEVYDGIEEIVHAYNYTYDIEKQLLYLNPDVNFLYGSMDEAIEYMISVGIEESDTDLAMVSAQTIVLVKYEIDGNEIRVSDTYDPNDLRTIEASNVVVHHYYGYIDFVIYDSENGKRMYYRAFIKYDGNNFSGSIYSYEYNGGYDPVSYTKKGEIKGTYSIDSENHEFALTVTECPAEIDIKGTHVLNIYL